MPTILYLSISEREFKRWVEPNPCTNCNKPIPSDEPFVRVDNGIQGSRYKHIQCHLYANGEYKFD